MTVFQSEYDSLNHVFCINSEIKTSVPRLSSYFYPFPIRQSLQEDEDGTLPQVNGPGQSAGSTVEGGLMLDLPAHEAVEEEGDTDAEQKDDIELHIDGSAQAVAEPPDEDDAQIERQDAERGTDVGEA